MLNELKEQMKGMSLIQKIDHLWTYYKIWLLVPVGIVVAIYVGVSVYTAKTSNVILNAVVVGSGLTEDDGIINDVKEYMGSTGKKDVVTIHSNVPADNLGKGSLVTLTTLIGANAVDVIISSKTEYEHLHEQNTLLDMGEALGEDAAKYGSQVQGDTIVVSDPSGIRETFKLPYEEIYISVFANAKHPEGAVEFVRYVLDYL